MRLEAEFGPPRIEFTSVPPIGSFDVVEGRAYNVDPRRHYVLLYIYVPDWGWVVKPYYAWPRTPIGEEGHWAVDYTTGGHDQDATKFVAFLRWSGVEPIVLGAIESLPKELYETSLAYCEVLRDSAPDPNPPPPELRWVGYDWWVKASTRPIGPGPNYFSDEADTVWVDRQGLHLRVREHEGKWCRSELVCRESFGYMTYRFVVKGVLGQLDRSTVLGLFTWSDRPEHAHREIDFIEVSRWGDPADPRNGEFVMQPYWWPGHRERFALPAPLDEMTVVGTWLADRVEFLALRGDPSGLPKPADTIHRWTFNGTLFGVVLPTPTPLSGSHGQSARSPCRHGCL